MLAVADTSAIIAVVMNEPERPLVIGATQGAELIAPASLTFEIGNAFTRLFRRRLISPEQMLLAWQAARGIPVALRDIDMLAALRLSGQHGVYAYDAYMLQCAIETSAALLTLDRRLKQTARAIGLDVME